MTEHLIGVISDTHGLLRPQAVQALEGVELIIHAGDIGDPKILRALKRIAPVHAVRGNTDRGDWAADLPHTLVVEVGGVHLYVLHELFCLDLDPAAAGIKAVIFGHSHSPPPGTQKRRPLPQPRQRRPAAVYLAGEFGIVKNYGNSLEPQLIDLKSR